jgi:hypothetical protein
MEETVFNVAVSQEKDGRDRDDGVTMTVELAARFLHCHYNGSDDGVDSPIEIALDDCVGVDIVDASLFVHLYAYPPAAPVSCGPYMRESTERVHTRWRLRHDDADVARRWRRCLLRLLQPNISDTARSSILASSSASSLKDAEAPAPRKVLVLVNPHSGAGHAKRAWKAAETMLTEHAASRVQVEMIETTHAGHARELIKGCDDLVNRCDAVVTVRYVVQRHATSLGHFVLRLSAYTNLT